MGKLDIQKIVSEELSELTEKEKRKILHDLDEAKVTPLKVSKAYDMLAKVTAELLKNLKSYKDATTDSEKEKYKKVAATLTAKKKQAQKLLNSMIVQLDKDAELHLENIVRSELNESMAKDVFKFAKEALLQTTKGRRLDQRYVRDYLKSIEQIARKKPGQFVKDYKDFGVADWVEDVEYNMRNEGFKSDAQRRAAFASGYKAKGKKGKKKEGKLNEAIILPAEKSLAKKLLKTKFTKKQNRSNYGYEFFVDNWKENTGSKIYRVPEFKAQFGVYPNGKVAFKYVESDSTNKAERETIFYNKPEDITEGKLNESMIGIKTAGNFKPADLQKALDKAKIKGYSMNRLSTTLTALKLDKKYFNDAKKIIDDLGLAVMMSKESVTEAAAELNKLKDAIKMFQDKIKKQGRITNARDEEHLKNLIALYKKMGGKGIKEGRLTEALNPKKAAKVIFDKLVFAKLIGQQNRKRAEGIIEFQLRAMNFGEGKIREDKSNELLSKLKTKLSDEGGAAGFQDLADTAKDMGVDLTPDMLKGMQGITQHRDGDYILEATDINDPVLVAIRALKTQLKKKTPVKKIKKISFDQYLKLIGIQEDLVEDMKDTAEDIQDLFRNMEQEAEPAGGPIADRYGAELDKLEKQYATLKKKKSVVDKKIENYRMM